jgi:cyclopropane fatty-acyl-phospholipid synthase-like methyltransferase
MNGRTMSSQATPTASPITRSYYDQTYYNKHEQRLKHGDRFTKVKVTRVFSLLNPRKGEFLLDLGSGVGTIMIALTQAGARTVGLDYSQKSLLIAKGHFKGRLPEAPFNGACSDGRAMGLKSGVFDGVAAIDFTEHLDDELLVSTISEVYRILKKGGRFVVYTPSVTHIFEKLKKRNIILKEDKSHIGLRTMKEYKTMLVKAGFALERSYFRPTDIPIFNALETLFMRLPFIGNLAKRRICICAVK